jgi:AmmeMemoRadiSam system protein B
MTTGVTKSWTRPPAVAGMFYPDERQALETMVKEFLNQARKNNPAESDPARCSAPGMPRALIAPHAGYVYSGPIAASAYVRLEPLRGKIDRVVLIGPSHRVALSGLATSSADAFDTPMGAVTLDKQAIGAILELPTVHVIDEAHEREHSLEVHLPFLIDVLGHGTFKLVPLAMGDVLAQQVAQVIQSLWSPRTLVIVSSDLSHFHDYETANRMDQATSHAIETLHPHEINRDQACGRVAIQGLLEVAQQRGLNATMIDQRNSADTGGRSQGQAAKKEVVGYGAYVFS